MKKNLAVFLLTSLTTISAFASWSLRPQLGLGHTNNANFESTGQDADFFWWLRSSNTYIEGKDVWSLWLNYRDYVQQNQNDVFTYRFGRTTEITSQPFGVFEWDLALGGQQYLNENPGTTEQSFNNIYLETSAAKTRIIKTNLDASFGPLYQITSFPSLGGRVDHTLVLNAGLDWSMTPIQTLSPYLDLGYVVSNQNLYSKQYLEIGADWRIEHTQSLKYIVHLVSKYSTYPNRLVTDTTAVTTRTGKIRTTSRDEIESQSFYQIQGTVAKLIGAAELRGAVAINQNSSLSGMEDYTEMQINGAVTVPFDF